MRNLVNKHGQPFLTSHKENVNFGYTFSVFTRKGTDTDYSVILFNLIQLVGNGNFWHDFAKISQSYYDIGAPLKHIPYYTSVHNKFFTEGNNNAQKTFKATLKCMDEETMEDLEGWMLSL